MNLPPPPPPPPAATSPHFHHLPDLHTAISTLTSLLDLSTSSLHSLPTLTPTPTSTSTPPLLPCPFNPNHKLPPPSLFSHYLNCPSPLSLPPPHYPHTLHSTTTPPTSTSSSSFSLENYIDYNTPNNFFYQNCPAPVTTPIQPPPLLTLPRVLYLECSQFNKDRVTIGFPVKFIRFLPSEIWAIRSEIETWGGGGFSIRILRAILRLRDCEFTRLCDWVVASSPKYGVIIDYAMRDHVLLLVRLCLKAIVREAFGLVGFIFDGEGMKMEENVLSSELNTRNFECPVLGEVLKWLGLQLGVLYGEVHGKFFAVDVLKECIVEAASSASLFSLEGKDIDADKVECETVGGSVVSVSQVAAAVAALHERSMIEGKIRALREARPLPAYQRNVEHTYVSKIAEEERQKRPNYKPIIEHDGLLWLRSRNQETNKIKTREELIAEERDYKRRRMSYRGKKLKRSTVEVMRDIIEEYMEEARRFGGVESEASVSDNLHKHKSDTGISGSKRNPEISEENEGHLHDYRKGRSTHDDSENSDHELQDFNRNVRRARQDKDEFLKNRNGSQSGSHSREQHSIHKRDVDEASREGFSQRSQRSGSKLHKENYYETKRYEREHISRKRERDERDRNSFERDRDKNNKEHRDRGRSKTHRYSRERDEDDKEHRNTQRSKTNRNNSSRHEKYNEFVDRYDPAVSS
ncbi:hypothetical protein ACJIZ3_022969 [Penstemon smallii]|uniref:CHHC U11-48K-type domain-containing protein n=1 Tax=Penstemon smallii TaxID=265156 RepID=A0ABD3TQ26_9LAMI